MLEEILESPTNRFNSVTQKGPKNTLSDIWITPKWIIDGLGGYGVFDLDPCGFLPNGNTPFVQTAKNYFTEEQDGLNQQWFGNVFVNFPYSDAKNWMNKISDYSKQGGSGIVLCFNRSDTRWFQNNVKCASAINMMKGRVKFLNSNGEEKGNGNAASILIAYGEHNVAPIANIPGILARIQ